MPARRAKGYFSWRYFPCFLGDFFWKKDRLCLWGRWGIVLLLFFVHFPWFHYAGNPFSAGVVFPQVCHDVNVDWNGLMFFLSSTIFWTDGKMSVWHVDMKAPYVRPLIIISFFGDGILCFTTIVIPIKLPACTELRHERPLWFCPFSRGKHANIWLATFLRRSTQITCFSIRDEAMRAALKPVFPFFFFSRTTLSDCG